MVVARHFDLHRFAGLGGEPHAAHSEPVDRHFVAVPGDIATRSSAP